MDSRGIRCTRCTHSEHIKRSGNKFTVYSPRFSTRYVVDKPLPKMKVQCCYCLVMIEESNRQIPIEQHSPHLLQLSLQWKRFVLLIKSFHDISMWSTSIQPRKTKLFSKQTMSKIRYSPSYGLIHQPIKIIQNHSNTFETDPM